MVGDALIPSKHNILQIQQILHKPTIIDNGYRKMEMLHISQ